MKPVVIIILMLMIDIAEAQVFKCETGTGKVIYQDEECVNSSKQKEIIIKENDPDKTKKAQEKLNRESQQQADLEPVQSIQTLK